MKTRADEHSAMQQTASYYIPRHSLPRVLLCIGGVLLLAACSALYAQEIEAATEQPETGVSQPESGTPKENHAARIADLPVHQSVFKVEPHYYGLPLSIQTGWFYRHEDFSIFPHIGFSFSVKDGPVVNTSVGFTLHNGAFFYNAVAVYNLFPFTMHKPADEQVVYGSSVIGFTAGNTRVSFPVQAGRWAKYEITEEKPDTTAATQKRVVTGLSSGVRLDFFLADFGFFKSTGTAAVSHHWIPKDSFHYYTLGADIPASFHLYYADIAFMYSFFHSGTVQYGKTKPLRRYEIEKPQQHITGRNAFKAAPKYTDRHFFSSEFRWYPIRLTAQTNGFFISAFADAGVGSNRQQKRTLLWECGGGIGYTLFDSVPFTFQTGGNQDGQPVFFLSVVSRLSHRP
ncbi:MAG: hypothetical protein ACTTJ7_00735 [Treponema sp.]